MIQMRRFVLVTAVLAAAGLLALGTGPAPAAAQAGRSGIQLISDVDLNCSFFLLETVPVLKVGPSTKGSENTMLYDNEEFYVDPGAEKLTAGQVWAILEMGPAVKSGSGKTLGNVAYKRARARVVRLEAGKARLKIEKGCGPVSQGNLLAPVAEGTPLRGEAQAYDVPFKTEELGTGRVVYHDNALVQISVGHWALIDLGTENGLQAGRQLVVFHQPEKTVPPQAIGVAVVVRVGSRSATIKVLAAKEAIRLGDIVQVK